MPGVHQSQDAEAKVSFRYFEINIPLAQRSGRQSGFPERRRLSSENRQIGLSGQFRRESEQHSGMNPNTIGA
jgi:hypothetical protein